MLTNINRKKKKSRKVIRCKTSRWEFDLHNLSSSNKVLINYKRESSNFTVEKSGKVHLTSDVLGLASTSSWVLIVRMSSQFDVHFGSLKQAMAGDLWNLMNTTNQGFLCPLLRLVIKYFSAYWWCKTSDQN